MAPSKTHQVVLGHHRPRVQLVNRLLHSLLIEKRRVADLVAHLDKVVQRHARDRVRVGLALRFKVGQRTLLVPHRAVKAARQRQAVFERAVHPLPVERHDRVRRIAQNAHLPLVLPRPRPNRHQRPHRVRRIIRLERWHQRHRVRVFPLEERPHVPLRPALTERVLPLVRPEERARERAVAVGQRDHHRAAPRPDVQRARLHRVPALAPRHRRYVQLFIPVLQVRLLILEAVCLHQPVAHRREGPVHAQHQVGLFTHHPAPGPLKDSRGPVDVHVDAGVLEVQPHRVEPRGLVEQRQVQAAARHTVDRVGRVAAVGLIGRRAVAPVHHPPPHGDGVALHHHAVEPHAGQPRQPAVESAIDRTPAGIPLPRGSGLRS